MLTHEIIAKAVKKIAPKYNISNAYYFGSYAKGVQNGASDLDLLVAFDTPLVSLYTIAGLAAELEKILQAEVDVLKLPLPKNTHLNINTAVKCYGA